MKPVPGSMMRVARRRYPARSRFSSARPHSYKFIRPFGGIEQWTHNFSTTRQKSLKHPAPLSTWLLWPGCLHGCLPDFNDQFRTLSTKSVGTQSESLCNSRRHRQSRCFRKGSLYAPEAVLWCRRRDAAGLMPSRGTSRDVRAFVESDLEESS